MKHFLLMFAIVLPLIGVEAHAATKPVKKEKVVKIHKKLAGATVVPEKGKKK